MANITISQMLQKLEDMYDREDAIIKEANILKAEYEQIQEDKELLQTMIMYASNRLERGGGRKKWGRKMS